MPEWLYEAGIGEERAALVEDGGIVEALIELPGGLRPGAIGEARLAKLLAPGRRGLAVFADGTEAMLEPLPPGVPEGRGCLSKSRAKRWATSARKSVPPRPTPPRASRSRCPNASPPPATPSPSFIRTSPTAWRRPAGASCWRRPPQAISRSRAARWSSPSPPP